MGRKNMDMGCIRQSLPLNTQIDQCAVAPRHGNLRLLLPFHQLALAVTGEHGGWIPAALSLPVPPLPSLRIRSTSDWSPIIG